MLAEKNNIDQLFQEKLRDYEKNPSMFLWNNIESKLDAQQRTRKINMIKGFGIAAAIMFAFLAGWWLSNTTLPNNQVENKIAGTVIQKNENINQTNKTQPLNQSALTDESANKSSEKISAGRNSTSGKQYKPSISSFASFAPSTSFLNKRSDASLLESKEPILVDVEKEFLSHFQNNLKLIKQLSAWVTSFNHNLKGSDTIQGNKQLNQLNKQFNSNDRDPFAHDTQKKSFNKVSNWTLSAGVAPVFTSQKQGRNYALGQNTTAENAVSGALMVGYKVKKRIVVKSGIIYSQLRQVTKNVDFSQANLTNGLPVGTSSAVVTPSGNVNFNKSIVLYSMNGLSNYNTSISGYQPVLRQEFGYIEIPVQATYKIIDHKFNVGVTGGIGANMLVGNKAGLFENGQRVNSGETANLRDVTYSGAMGLELGYDLGSRITLIVEPRVKHFINSLSSNKTVDFKPNQLDIITGVTYSFN